MDREIKFRGLTANGEWIYGDLTHDALKSTLYYKNYSQRIHWREGGSSCNQPVKNGTVGQYTGLHDKNGKPIYEGDIVVQDEKATGFPPYDGTEPRVVQFKNGCWCFDAGRYDDGDWIRFGFWTYSNEGQNCLHQLEVIGNIYENKELLEVSCGH